MCGKKLKLKKLKKFLMEEMGVKSI